MRAVLVFSRTLSPTAPRPLPDCPEETVTQERLLLAVQAHPSTTVTSTRSAPPAALRRALSRSRLNRHGAPTWLSCARASPTAIAVDLIAAVGLAATR